MVVAVAVRQSYDGTPDMAAAGRVHCTCDETVAVEAKGMDGKI